MLGAVFSWLAGALGWLASTLFSPITLGLVAILVVTMYLYLTRHKNYWKNQGVPHKPYKFPFGSNGFEILTKQVIYLMQEVYDKRDKAAGFTAIYDLFGPAMMVYDPEMIKAILVKDFDYFPVRTPESFNKTLGSIISKMMTSLAGQEWKDVRGITSPVFSTGKIRQMCGPCAKHGDILAEQMYKESQASGEIDVKDVMSRFTMDVIATVAFGLEADSIRNPDSTIAANAKQLTKRPTAITIVRFLIMASAPDWVNRLISNEGAFLDNEATQYFTRITKESIRRRNEHPEERRNDFLQLLLDTRRDDTAKRQLSDEEIIAQCVLFYLAGYDTTSNTLTWAARLLAFNPAVQERLQAEIDDKLPSDADQLTFEKVNDMPYLDRVLAETLRMYPPPQVVRSAVKPYRLPGTEVTIPSGANVYMHAYCLHHDPEIYPDPETFDPDRFLPEAKETRHPYHYLPFGHGPRNCIGMRFAQLEAKVALVCVLRRYSFATGPRSGSATPQFGFDTNLVREKDGTWLKVVKRSEL